MSAAAVSGAKSLFQGISSKSIWIKNGKNGGSRTYAPLSGLGGHYDVCVVGGGIVGVSTAYALKKSGKSVALLEARSFGSGITGNSTAKMTSLHGASYSKIEKLHGKETAKLYGMMQEDSIARAEQLVRDLNLDCEWERKSHITWTASDTYVPLIESEYKLLSELAFSKVRLLQTESELSFLPKSIGQKIAVEAKDQIAFNSFKYCAELAKHIDGEKCKVYEGTRVLDVKTTAGAPHVVECEAGNVTADSVVLATHLPILDRGLHFAMFEPSKSHCIAFTVNDPKQIDDMQMHINCEQPERSTRASINAETGEKVVVLCGESVKTGDHPDTRELYKTLMTFASLNFDVKQFVSKWSAMDYWSSDYLPYIGHLTRSSNSLYCATAFGKWGLANGVAAGAIINDLIMGVDNKYHKIVDALRWDLKATPGHLEEAWHTAKHMIGDKVSAWFGKDISTLKLGEGGVVKHKGETLGVYLDEQGAYHAVKPLCTHLGCNVVFNSGDKVWDCPCHGSQFEVDGTVIHGPACKNLEKKELQW